LKKNSICATGPQNTNYLFSFADFNVRFLCVCFATLNSLSSDIRGATINKREGGESPLLRLSCFRIRRRVLIRCETLRRRRHMNEIGQGVDHPFSLSSRADDGGGGGEREGETRTVRRGEGRIARTRRRDRSTLVCPLSPWFSPIFLERVWWKSMMRWPFARRHRQIESGATLIERWRWLSERRRFILIRHPNCGQLMWEWKEIKKKKQRNNYALIIIISYCQHYVREPGVPTHDWKVLLSWLSPHEGTIHCSPKKNPKTTPSVLVPFGVEFHLFRWTKATRKNVP
jgi:hypothetical protein